MNKKDINKKPFDEGTLLKLDIFRKCFREWFPVFIFNSYIKSIYVYDLFAGSGKDSVNNPGSPLILLEEARGDQGMHCLTLNESPNKSVYFAFNEKEKQKFEELKYNTDTWLSDCQKSCPLASGCIHKGHLFHKNAEFKTVFETEGFNRVLSDSKSAKFIILDQYGFSQVTENVFDKLIHAPNTDFIFFISSSTVRRFKEHPSVQAYLDTNSISFNENNPKECHRAIASYFKGLVPDNLEYYIKSFTIQKGSNYYGLILGSAHSLGMEKFVKVCWAEDPLAGESNCNINNDFEVGSLFYESGMSNIKNEVSEALEKRIVSGEIRSNITGLKWVLSQGCQPKLFVEVINKMLKTGKIEVSTGFNQKSTRIHSIPEYRIIVK